MELIIYLSALTHATFDYNRLLIIIEFLIIAGNRSYQRHTIQSFSHLPNNSYLPIQIRRNNWQKIKCAIQINWVLPQLKYPVEKIKITKTCVIIFLN